MVRQAPLSMGFSRQEYWSGLPFPSPRVLPDPGIEPRPLELQTVYLPSEPPGVAIHYRSVYCNMLWNKTELGPSKDGLNIKTHVLPWIGLIQLDPLSTWALQRKDSPGHG